MFDDLDATVKALLDDAAAPQTVRDADVSFDTPDRDFKPAQATLNLFLHEVVENRTLREEGPVTIRTESGFTTRMPYLRVDCTYLVTAWSNQTGGLKAAAEHRLLGSTLQWLGRFPVIGETFHRGVLRNPPQPYPLSTVVAQTQEGRSAAEFWSALGVAPRPAFPLTVTLTVQPYDEVEQAVAPKDFRVTATPPEHPQLAGRVLDHTLAPASGTTVVVVGTGKQAVTTADGEFAVPGLEFGSYTLRVQKPGSPAQEVAMEYAATHQRLTVVLRQP
ncbi:Pvc16 family protein [Actinoplanes sp. NPDC051861]|uniref:Pvc16 family protein n=1 Tax=Actinoplanes sp. NPDC051861 TaxID=3155170 RepID=UPI0034451EA5